MMQALSLSCVNIVNSSCVIMKRTYRYAFVLISLTALYTVWPKSDHYHYHRPSKELPHQSTLRRELCIQETICKLVSNDLVYEYQRGESFERRLHEKVKSGMRVPSIIHFTWFRGKNAFFRFHQLVAVMAVHKTMGANIYLWFDYMPFGENWIKLINLNANIFLVHRVLNEKRKGDPSFLEDRVRYEAVLEFGGTGLTFDIILLKPLNHFFPHDVTMGTTSSGISTSVIIAKPWSTFMVRWYLTDTEYNQASSSETMSQTANVYRKSIYFVSDLVKPNQENLSYLYKDGYQLDWVSDAICVKLWYDKHRVEHSPEDIQTWNTVAGRIFRFIYWNS